MAGQQTHPYERSVRNTGPCFSWYGQPAATLTKKGEGAGVHFNNPITLTILSQFIPTPEARKGHSQKVCLIQPQVKGLDMNKLISHLLTSLLQSGGTPFRSKRREAMAHGTISNVDFAKEPN